MRVDIIETFKFIGYVIFMPLFMVVGVVYKALKWITHHCADFDKHYVNKYYDRHE